jgi:hypothetical protein
MRKYPISLKTIKLMRKKNSSAKVDYMFAIKINKFYVLFEAI